MTASHSSAVCVRVLNSRFTNLRTNSTHTCHHLATTVESILSFPIARLLLGAPTRRRAQATEQQVQAALAAAAAPLMQSQRQQQRQWLRQTADAVSQSSRGRRVSEKSLEYCCKTPKLCTVDKDCFQLSPCCAEARTLASGSSSGSNKSCPPMCDSSFHAVVTVVLADSGSETVLDGGAPPPVTTGSVRDAVKQAFISEYATHKALCVHVCESK